MSIKRDYKTKTDDGMELEPLEGGPKSPEKEKSNGVQFGEWHRFHSYLIFYYYDDDDDVTVKCLVVIDSCVHFILIINLINVIVLLIHMTTSREQLFCLFSENRPNAVVSFLQSIVFRKYEYEHNIAIYV